MADTLLPPSIRDERSLIFEGLVNRMPALDLSVLGIYNIDTVDESALYDLASQFNVLGKRGWALCTTTADRRNLIKQAVPLHKYAGTAWAIKNAIKTVGFASAEIEENPVATYNGDIAYDGYDNYEAMIWGGFRVFVDPGTKSLTTQQQQLLTDLINEWKNARSQLLSVGIRFTVLPYTGLPTRIYDGSTTYNAGNWGNYTFFWDGTQAYDGSA